MADKTARHPENAKGPYYVDQECIACDTCVGLAPGYFSLTPSYSYAYVVRQPLTERDQLMCEEARLSCPVDAIGRDG